MTKSYQIDFPRFPAINRFGVGFDKLFSDLESAFATATDNYPPHNIIIRGENHYTIEMAVAGFTQEELDIEIKGKTLRVSGKRLQEVEAEETEQVEYLHRGLSSRDFVQYFRLADNYVKVDSAKIKNGILVIDLTREVPEEELPKKIAISAS